MIDFTEEQIQRYSRHILLQDVGVEGQEKIMNARVLVVGAGGLGAPVSLYLAAAGIGTIGIVDADVVDLSNLQRCRRGGSLESAAPDHPLHKGCGCAEGKECRGENQRHQPRCES